MSFTDGVRKKLFIGLLVAGAAAATAPWSSITPLFSSAESSNPVSAALPQRAEGPAPHGSLAGLPVRAPLGKLRGELFAAPPAPPAVKVAAQQAPAKPLPPAMPYRVAGTVTHDGVSKVVLVKGDSVLSIEIGEILEGGYRVESIGAHEVVLLYVPLGVRERLPVISTIGVDADETPLARTPPPDETASAGAGSVPAQLR